PDLHRAIRKNQFFIEGFSNAQLETLEMLRQYIKRVPIFDYMNQFTSGQVAKQGALVAEVSNVIAELHATGIDPALAEQIGRILSDGTPRANAANAAKFYARAATLKNRIVLNADM